MALPSNYDYLRLPAEFLGSQSISWAGQLEGTYPFLSILLLIVGFALGWVVVGHFYRERLDTKDSQIALHQAEIAGYRERLGLAPREGKYAKLTHAELKTTTEEFLARLKEFHVRFERAMRTNKDIDKVMDSMNTTFEHSFRAQGINIREELRRRVPTLGQIGPLPFVAAWDHGVLAGANAFGEAITEIQRLVDQMPPTKP